MKVVKVSAKFPDVDTVENVIEEKSEASTFKAAISRAIGNILKNPGLKRKRIKRVSLEVEVLE